MQKFLSCDKNKHIMTHSTSQLIFSKKAFLWDFDGCVCDSEEMHYEAYAQAFRHFNHEVKKNEYFHTFTHTGGGVAKEAEKYNLTCSHDEVKNLKSQYYSGLLENKTIKVFPEVPKILSKLRVLGIKSVIASNSPRHEIELLLKRENILDLFEDIIGLEAGLRKKPAPDIFLKALKVLSIDAKDALVIEDSERGLIAAQKAGCDALWIKTHLNSTLTSDAPYREELTHQELLSYVDG